MNSSRQPFKSRYLLRLLGMIGHKVLVGPERLEIECHTACNLACKFCWFHSPYVSRQPRPWSISWKDYKKVISDAAAMGCETVYLTGQGEPTLHPRFADMVLWAKQHPLRVTVTTNMTFSSLKNLKALARADVVEATLSACTKQNYRLVHGGTADLFGRVMRNLRNLNRLLSLQNKKQALLLNYIVTKLNVDEMVPFVRFAKKQGYEKVRFSCSFHEHFPESLIMDEKTLRQVRQSLLVLSEDKNVDVTDFFRRPRVLKKCYMGWLTMLVESQGGVKIGCFDPPSPLLGNIEHDSLRDIWFSSRAQKIRECFKNSLEKMGKTSHCPFYYLNQNLQKDLKVLLKNSRKPSF